MPEEQRGSFLRHMSMRQALMYLLPFFGMLLLGRAQVLDGIRPFAAAFAMAGWLGGLPVVSLVFGCAAGSLFSTMTLASAALQTGAVVLMLLIAEGLKRLRGRDWDMPLWLASLVCGGSVAAVFAGLGSHLLYDLIQSGLSAVFAALLVPVFARALRSKAAGRRTALSTDEVISIALTLSLFLLGISDVRLGDVSVAGILTVLLCLLSGYLGGAGAGAATGVLLGVVLSLTGTQSLFLSGTLGLCGLLAGTLRGLKRVGAVIAFFAGEFMTAAYVGDATNFIVPVWEVLLAGAIFLLIPAFLMQSMREAVDIDTHRKAGQKYYARRVREMTVKRLHEFSDVFASMGQAFTDLVDQRQESVRGQNDEILMTVAGQVCDGCGLKSRCWQREAERTVGLMREVVREARASGGAGNWVPEAWKRFCLRPHEVADLIYKNCELSDIDRKWQMRVQECRHLVGAQLGGVSQVIDELALQLDDDVHFSDEVARRILEDADRQGIRLREVLVQEDTDGHVEVHLEMRACKEQNACQGDMLRVLRMALGKPMRRVACACPTSGWCQLTYIEAKGFVAETAAAQRMVGDVCGDSYVCRELPGGKLLLAISDGMGTGARASQESRMTVELLEEFFRVGFDEELIFRVINQLMMLRKPDEVFSTVDLCLVDLVTGTAEFIKIGATFGCLKRAGRCQIIKSNSLPLGILEEVSPYVEEAVLQAGDLIVLVSDGVADVVGDRDERWLSQALDILDAPHPADIAEAILREAENRDGYIKDDMTILVARVQSAG